MSVCLYVCLCVSVRVPVSVSVSVSVFLVVFVCAASAMKVNAWTSEPTTVSDLESAQRKIVRT